MSHCLSDGTQCGYTTHGLASIPLCYHARAKAVSAGRNRLYRVSARTARVLIIGQLPSIYTPYAEGEAQVGSSEKGFPAGRCQLRRSRTHGGMGAESKANYKRRWPAGWLVAMCIS